MGGGLASSRRLKRVLFLPISQEIREPPSSDILRSALERIHRAPVVEPAAGAGSVRYFCGAGVGRGGKNPSRRVSPCLRWETRFRASPRRPRVFSHFLTAAVCARAGGHYYITATSLGAQRPFIPDNKTRNRMITGSLWRALLPPSSALSSLIGTYSTGCPSEKLIYRYPVLLLQPASASPPLPRELPSFEILESDLVRAYGALGVIGIRINE